MGIGSLLGTLSLVGLVAFIGGIALVVLSASQGRPVRNGILIAVIGGVVALLLGIISGGLLILQPQEVAVVFNSVTGELAEPRTAGTSIIIPGVQEYTIYPIEQQNFSMTGDPSGSDDSRGSVVGRTRDGQEIRLDVTVLYSIDPLRVNDVHRNWRNRYEEQFMLPTVRGFVRDEVSGYTAVQVYSQSRDELALGVEELLRARMEQEGLILSDLIIRDITFSEQFSQSIENAQIAQQEAERARLVVQQVEQEAAQARAQAEGQRDAAITRAEGEAQAIILRAQAEAEALRLVSEQIAANPSLIQYQYIQSLADNISLALIPSNSPFLFDFNSIAEGNLDFTAPAVPEVQGFDFSTPTPTPEATPGS